jgi:Fe-S-cluster containining protein
MSKKAKQRRIAALQAKFRATVRALEAHEHLIAGADPLPHAIWTQEHHTATLLAQGRSETEALAVGESMTQQATLWITEILSAPGVRVDCAPGCAWCCTIPVAVSPPEALLIAEHLRTSLSPEALATVRARLQTRAAEIAPLSWEAHADAILPCALLDGGHCTVYEARPVACRAWTSPDARQCQHAQTHPWSDVVTPVGPCLDVAAATQLGVTAGLLCSGVSAAYLELHSAVCCALATPRAAERWAQGEPVFQHCKRADHVNATLEGHMAAARAAARTRASTSQGTPPRF